ncbi:MAG: hypothetical protein K6A92_00115 [Lachnospiraceae bacterium]|nr:hypothetical protein [Lachnospiraceae bacterium]
MNNLDLLDAIGGIDPKYIAEADKAVSGQSRRSGRIRSFRPAYLIAAALFLLLLSGAFIRTNLLRPVSSESADTSAAVTTTAEIMAEEAAVEEAAPEESDQSVGTFSIQENQSSEQTEGSAKETTPETATATATTGDYPPMLMVNGILYQDSYEVYEPVTDPDATAQVIIQTQQVLTYTDGEPSADGEQNFDRSCETIYVEAGDGTDAIYVRMEEEANLWHIFVPAVQ